jgi:hypothetical protein
VQHANPRQQSRKTGLAIATEVRHDNGFFEVAILSLGGLALSLFVLAHDIGVGALQLALGR